MTNKIKLMSDEEIESEALEKYPTFHLYTLRSSTPGEDFERNEFVIISKNLRDECEKRAFELGVKLIKHIYQLGCFELSDSGAKSILQQFLKEQDSSEEKVG